MEISSIGYLAFAEHLRGDLEAASEEFNKAEALSEKINLTKYLYGLDRIQHADHLMRMDKTAYAREVTKDNLKIYERNHWKGDTSRCHRVLGDLDANAGEHNAAIVHYNEALKIAREITNRPVLIEALLARGRYAAKHVKSAKSANEDLSDLEEALSYAMSGGYRILEADIRVALGWARIAASDKEKAKAEAAHAKRMSDDMGYFWGKKDADEVLSEIQKP